MCVMYKFLKSQPLDEWSYILIQRLRVWSSQTINQMSNLMTSMHMIYCVIVTKNYETLVISMCKGSKSLLEIQNTNRSLLLRSTRVRIHFFQHGNSPLKNSLQKQRITSSSFTTHKQIIWESQVLHIRTRQNITTKIEYQKKYRRSPE